MLVAMSLTSTAALVRTCLAPGIQAAHHYSLTHHLLARRMHSRTLSATSLATSGLGAGVGPGWGGATSQHQQFSALQQHIDDLTQVGGEMSLLPAPYTWHAVSPSRQVNMQHAVAR